MHLSLAFEHQKDMKCEILLGDTWGGGNQGCLPFTQTIRVEILCINVKLNEIWRAGKTTSGISKSAE